jgi:cytochrome P450
VTTLTPDGSAFSAAARTRHAALYADANKPLADLVHVEDPAFYINPWPIYDRLRTEAPAYFHEALNTWILTRHQDVQFVSRHPEIFSAKHGILLYDGVNKASALGELFAGNGDLIGLTDPPRHTELRRVMQPPFTPPALARLIPRIEAYCDQLLDGIVPGETVDWAQTVATRLPVLVVAAILGIPDDDEEFFERVGVWTDATEELVGRDLSTAEFEHTVAAFGSLNDFIAGMFDAKRACPAEDFLTSLLNDHLDNDQLSQSNRVGFAQLLISAGVDTSRSLLSELIAHLAMYPEQRALLCAEPDLIANAIEEVLRFAPAAHGFARQLVQDIELHGQQLKAGQRVWMAYDAANRDPAVFDRPHEFDVRRESNRKNLAFGFGVHVCIAAPQVRLETRLLLQKLLDRFPRFELAGVGRRAESFLRNGWVELPIVFHRS